METSQSVVTRTYPEKQEIFERRTNDVVQLFSTTLRSLSADATTVRQATSLARSIGVYEKEGDEVEKENDPNGQRLRQGLVDLECLVSEIEEKVTALQQIVGEEKRSLTQFEGSLQEEAQQQSMMVDQLAAALHEHLLNQKTPARQGDGDLPLEKKSDTTDLHLSGNGHNPKNDSLLSESTSTSVGVGLDCSSSEASSLSSSTTWSQKRSLAKNSHGQGSRRDSFDPRHKPRRLGQPQLKLAQPNSKQRHSLPDHSKSNGNTAVPKTNRRSHSIGRSSTKTCRDDSMEDCGEGENQVPLPISSTVSLARITQDELDDYKARNVMAPRTLSLMNVNEALDEIEAACRRQQKITLSLRYRQQDMQHHHSHLSSGALQRRYDYLQRRQHLSHKDILSSVASSQHHQQEQLQVNSNGIIANDTLGNVDYLDLEPISVTEQELRESCAFFRHGESTARATLSVLCSLRRLKQVPSKNRQVTYICLESTTVESQVHQLYAKDG